MKKSQPTQIPKKCREEFESRQRDALAKIWAKEGAYDPSTQQLDGIVNDGDAVVAAIKIFNAHEALKKILGKTLSFFPLKEEKEYSSFASSLVSCGEETKYRLTAVLDGKWHDDPYGGSMQGGLPMNYFSGWCGLETRTTLQVNGISIPWDNYEFSRSGTFKLTALPARKEHWLLP